MKKTFISLLLLFACVGIQAQSNLTGRVYYNANVAADKMKEITQEAKKEAANANAEAVKKAEEKKKRKLTDAEKAEVEKEAEKAQKMAEAILKGTRTGVTVTFKDEKTVVMKMEMKIDDEAMKNAGIGWAKRKLIHAATALSPSEKAKYTVKDNMVILEEGNEKDTMYLSNDGKYLSGKLDEDMPFKLTRTK